MLQIIKKICVLILIFLIYQNIFSIDQFQIATMNIPPYSYKENGENKGIGSEKIKLLQNELNIDYEIVQYPEMRAFKIAETFSDILIYPVLRSKQNETKYKWIYKIADNRNYLFRYKTSKPKDIREIDDAKNIE